MFNISKYFFLILLFLLMSNCAEKISYSGKILNKNDIDYQKLKSLNDVLDEIGEPNFIDPIENKYYYYTEKKKIKNFFNQKIINRKVIIFKFNEKNKVIEFAKYDLNNKNDIEYMKDKTPNEVIKRGLLEKIFGGVTANTPTTQ